MATRNELWWKRPKLWVEAFAIVNLGFLTFDIYLAHSVNQFRNRAEYVPLVFSAIAPVVLLLALGLQQRWHRTAKVVGYLVGWSAICVGLTGVVLHLESRFFYERTLRSLTYSAPFAAPLAYTGLGFLVLLNRMVDSESMEWAQWVLWFCLGGFFGNFIFSLADHAGNGFFNSLEWTPVIASALAVGFLTVPLVRQVSQRFIEIALGILAAEVVVGVWGFFLHAVGNLRGPSIHAYDNFIYGAPPLAPLLFPNLAFLGAISLWCIRKAER